MACDILGPRGDDKNGFRQEWLAFCETELDRPSAITSFRDNRFNNAFQGESLYFIAYLKLISILTCCPLY